MQEAETFVKELTKRGYQVSTAESCTGGMIASAIVDVPGASFVFEEGYVTYSNRVKEKLLGVSSDTIAEHSVVSEEVAMEMAAGVQDATGADVTISVTGYAGPGAAEDGTEAGTVYIGTWFREKCRAKKFVFEGDRRQVREQAVTAALCFALERIKQGE